jgi:hypothetical protein
MSLPAKRHQWQCQCHSWPGAMALTSKIHSSP